MSTERALTCGDAADLLDAFVDAELPAPTLLAVARHAGGCAACDAAIRELTAVSQMAGRRLAAEVEGLDLGRVWPAVSRGIELADARAAWRRRLRSLPAWGVALAAAASALFWLRAPGPDPVHIARVRPNQAVIDRINSSGHIELRRERKNGTTLIMWSADGDPAGQ